MIPLQERAKIWSQSSGPFLIYLEYLDANKMMDKVEISIWNIWMWRKWEVPTIVHRDHLLHQDINSGPTLWRRPHYLWFILGAPLCRASCRCTVPTHITLIWSTNKKTIIFANYYPVSFFFAAGDLRFSPPIEAAPWTETRNATKAKSLRNVLLFLFQLLSVMF